MSELYSKEHESEYETMCHKITSLEAENARLKEQVKEPMPMELLNTIIIALTEGCIDIKTMSYHWEKALRKYIRVKGEQ